MKKQITVGNKIFKTQTECEKYTRLILQDLGTTNSVKIKNEEYFNFLFLLCKRHPHYIEKMYKFADFEIKRDALNKQAFALNIINHDNTHTEISWRICVTGIDKSSKSLFNSALRYCISYQILDFKNTSDLSSCTKCNCCLHDKIVHIDHDKTQFTKLVDDFLNLHKEIKIPIEYNKKDITFQTIFKNEDAWIGKLFEKYHLQNATLRVLCQSCNLTRKKYKNH